MACNLAALTSGNIKSFSAGDPSTDINNDNILTRMQRYSYELSRTDCGDTVYNYFNKLSNGDLDAVNQKVTGLMDIGAWMTRLADFVRNKTDDRSHEITDMLCLTVNGWYKTMLSMIEDVLKIIPTALKKIDDLIAQIQQVILNFGIEIKNCIIKVINDVQVKLNALTASAIDFTKLNTLMDACPCVTKAVASMFGCSTGETPAGVISCIQNKFGLSPTNALKSMNKFFNNTLKASIELVFAALENAVRYVLKVLMQPVRELVKYYCDALNHKFDVSAFISTVGAFECFFSYSVERKTVSGKPVAYKGMSTIDILNSFKQWATCFDGICSFSSTLKLEIQKQNENLRLNSKFWKDPYTVDIFQACMAVTAGITTSAAETRGIFVEQQDKGKNSLIDLYDNVKKLRSSSTPAYQAYSDMGASEASALKPEPEYATGTDTGNMGAVKEFYYGVENDLVSMVKVLESGFTNESYYRMLAELRTWALAFKKDKLLDEFTNAEYIHSRMMSLGNSNGSVSVTSSSYTYQSVEVFDPAIVPSYSTSNDFVAVSFNNKPVKSKSNDLGRYYADWYSLNVA